VNFRRLGNCFLCAAFFKITKVAHIFGQRFPRKKFCIDFDLKMGWATYWAFFYKLIRSPWSAKARPSDATRSKQVVFCTNFLLQKLFFFSFHLQLFYLDLLLSASSAIRQRHSGENVERGKKSFLHYKIRIFYRKAREGKSSIVVLYDQEYLKT
jgi:hypothetical protein